MIRYAGWLCCLGVAVLVIGCSEPAPPGDGGPAEPDDTSKTPEINAQYWINTEPLTLAGLRGKIVVLEFWATWCPPCRRSIPILNRFHAKFGKELVVVGISDETEADVRKLKDPAVTYYSAIDTRARTKNALGVFGIPHVIIIEPGGFVVWEGFPLLKGYELTDEKIEKILAVGRKGK